MKISSAVYCAGLHVSQFVHLLSHAARLSSWLVHARYSAWVKLKTVVLFEVAHAVHILIIMDISLPKSSSETCMPGRVAWPNFLIKKP